MNMTDNHDARMAGITFASVYPLYLEKVVKKGRTKKELDQVIEWLTGYDERRVNALFEEKATFEQFLRNARFHPNAHLISGVICGYCVEEIRNTLTQKVRYLDKLVYELAKGRRMEKIMRQPAP